MNGLRITFEQVTAVREIVHVYRAYGFRRIETPALEHLRLLAGSEGGENEKLIFKVLKRGEELESARRAEVYDRASTALPKKPASSPVEIRKFNTVELVGYFS